MSLNVTTLATRWGKIFGGMNQYDTFRGTTIYQRADTINALYPDADEQRIVVDNLYDRTVLVDQSMDSIVSFYMTMAKNTLLQMSLDDDLAMPDTSDVALLNKLITDMIATGQTFQRPTVQINSALSALLTSVTTPQGLPSGNGVIVGTVVNPRLGIAYYYPYSETLRVVCATDSYTSGVVAGQETFNITGGFFYSYENSSWPGQSGLNVTLSSLPTSQSTLISNAYFSEWDDTNVNTPETWELFNLSPGTTITRNTDYYSADYAVRFTSAPLNAELRQPIVGLSGSKNYVLAIRIKRPGVITGGVLRLAITDEDGTPLLNALGVDLALSISLSGGSGGYILSQATVSVPKLSSVSPHVSIKFTTAMTGGESILIDNFELIPTQILYPSGPELAFIPGNVPWAINDTYKGDVVSNAIKSTFIKNFERVYQISTLGLDIPTASSPTQSDGLIS